jgi:cyclohexyl-isocyanide hydratase
LHRPGDVKKLHVVKGKDVDFTELIRHGNIGVNCGVTGVYAKRYTCKLRLSMLSTALAIAGSPSCPIDNVMTIHIGFIVFPGIQHLDLAGPYDVFASLDDVQLHLIWKHSSQVIASNGLPLIADTTFADCPKLDVICMPGGAGIGALMEDDETLAFLRKQAATAAFVTSVCTGALVLGAAGLLRGRRATTHWAYHTLLAPFGAIPVHGRVVRDGNVLTGGGVTAGIDFALTLIGELMGADEAQAIQLQLEYAPAPPFAAGHPDTAPSSVLEIVRERTAKNLTQRAAIVARAAARI